MSALLRRCLAVAVLVIAGCNSPAKRSPSAPAAESIKVEILSREERLALGTDIERVVILNPHGDVRVRSVAGSSLGYYATIQRLGEEPQDPIIELQQKAGIVTLAVRYAKENKTVGPRIGRVDLAVYVPPLPLEVMTRDGLAQVRRAQAAVRARSDSGTIEVSASADLDLHSRSGQITLTQFSGEWTQPIQIQSDSGPVLATIPAFADIQVSAKAAGQISLPQGWSGAVQQGSGMRFERSFGSGLRQMHITSGADIWIQAVIPDSALTAPNQGQPEQ